jgi:hypothetical protein
MCTIPGMSDDRRQLPPAGLGYRTIVGVKAPINPPPSHEVVTTTTGAGWEVAAAREPDDFGAMAPVELRIRRQDGRPLAASHLRRIPLGAMLDDARALLRSTAHAIDHRTGGARTGDPVIDGLVDSLTTGPHRGRALTRAQLQAVADVYINAKRRGWPVTDAVAEAFNVSKSTAGKRIMAARDAGLLPPVERKAHGR